MLISVSSQNIYDLVIRTQTDLEETVTQVSVLESVYIMHYKLQDLGEGRSCHFVLCSTYKLYLDPGFLSRT